MLVLSGLAMFVVVCLFASCLRSFGIKIVLEPYFASSCARLWTSQHAA